MSWSFRLTSRALDDLREIRSFIAIDSPEAGKAFRDDLVRQAKSLADNEVPGTPKPELFPTLRSFPYRRRTIFFVVRDGRLSVIRILHQARNVQPKDFE